MLKASKTPGKERTHHFASGGACSLPLNELTKLLNLEFSVDPKALFDAGVCL